MGVATNSEKIREFSDEQRYIGFIWNTRDRTVRLPEKKLAERIKQVRHFLTLGKSFNFKEVEKFTGWLVHTTYIVPSMQCYMPPLHQWKQE
jgi:hypothetical protein